MLDLTTLSNEVLLARGQYSTVNGEHKDETKRLSKLCGQLMSVSTQVLKKMQPDNDEIPCSIESLLNMGKETLAEMEQCAANIESLAKQKAELKPLAWGR